VSARWALFERFDIREPNTGELYLRRWRIIQTPWFGVLLHKILTPDGDRHLHDHPWSFLGVVLRGGYAERLPGGGFRVKARRPLRPYYKRAEDPHRIMALDRVPTWTLLLVGRRKRTWGFYTEQGWIDWRAYLNVSQEVSHEE